MLTSTQPLLKLIFSNKNVTLTAIADSVSGTSTPMKGNALTSPTICTQFRSQLALLMAKIDSTKPHYIRCIKPNDLNRPDSLDRLRTTEQLRYGGVLEAVRVARAGFPVRLSHAEFYGRYRPLANPFMSISKKLPRYLSPTEDHAKACATLLELMWDQTTPKLTGSEKNYAHNLRLAAETQFWRGSPSRVETNSIQLGRTKVFFRKPAHDLFEGRRSRQSVVAVRRIQALARRFVARVRYLKALRSVFRLQIAIRFFLFHRRFVKKRRFIMSRRIQTGYRRHLHSRRFRSLLSALLSVQTRYRGRTARKLFVIKIADWKAIILQKFFRSALARLKFKGFRRAVIALQCRLRVRKARRELKALRIQAKDVVAMKAKLELLKAQAEAREKAEAEAKLKAEEEARLAAIVRRKEEERLKEEARLAQIEREKEENRLKEEARLAQIAREAEEAKVRQEALAREMEAARIREEALAKEREEAHLKVLASEREKAEAKAHVEALEKTNAEQRLNLKSMGAAINALEAKVVEKDALIYELQQAAATASAAANAAAANLALKVDALMKERDEIEKSNIELLAKSTLQISDIEGFQRTINANECLIKSRDTRIEELEAIVNDQLLKIKENLAAIMTLREENEGSLANIKLLEEMRAGDLVVKNDLLNEKSKLELNFAANELKISELEAAALSALKSRESLQSINSDLRLEVQSGAKSLADAEQRVQSLESMVREKENKIATMASASAAASLVALDDAAALKHQIAALQAQRDLVDSACNALADKERSTSEKIVSLAAALEEKELKIKSVNANLLEKTGALKGKIDILYQEKADSEAERASLTRRNVELAQKISELKVVETNQQRFLHEQEATISRLEAESHVQSDTIIEQLALIKDFQSSSKELKERLVQIQLTNDRIASEEKEKVIAMELSIRTLTSNLQETEEKVIELEGQLRLRSADSAKLEAASTATSAAVAALTAENAQFLTDHASLKGELSNLKLLLQEKEEQVAIHSSRSLEVQNNLEALTQEKLSLQAQVHEQEAIVAAMESANSALNEEVTQMKTWASMLEKELSASLATIEDYENGKEVLKRDKDDLESRARNQRAMIDALEGRSKEQDEKLSATVSLINKKRFDANLEAFKAKMQEVYSFSISRSTLCLSVLTVLFMNFIGGTSKSPLFGIPHDELLTNN